MRSFIVSIAARYSVFVKFEFTSDSFDLKFQISDFVIAELEICCYRCSNLSLFPTRFVSSGVVIVNDQRIETSDENIRFRDVALHFYDFDIEKFLAEIVRDREDRGESSPSELSIENLQGLDRIVIRYFNHLNWFDPRDQQMRSEMTDAATVENADRSLCRQSTAMRRRVRRRDRS